MPCCCCNNPDVTRGLVRQGIGYAFCASCWQLWREYHSGTVEPMHSGSSLGGRYVWPASMGGEVITPRNRLEQMKKYQARMRS